jgi:glyoxylase-like metal-dependent hydrolase (beta-lactamase superfamily II)
MSTIKIFPFNPFEENTYIIYDETKNCIIIDPGAYYEHERFEMVEFLKSMELIPKFLVNTHCHIDHVLSNKFIAETYGLELYGHREDIYNLVKLEEVGRRYGVAVEASPEMKNFLSDGDDLCFGNTVLTVLHTPGHSLGSITLYNKNENYAIVGDVIFQGSIGRTDLPGGDFEVLEKSIKDKIYHLPEDTILYPGHGAPTTVRKEKWTNPFVKI